MAEVVQKIAADKPAQTQTAAPATRKSKKALIIVAVVIIQLVAAYFLMGFLLKRGGIDPKEATSSVPGHAAAVKNTPADAGFDHVYVVKDLIVNPAGTNGLRFLLTTIGLEVSSEQTVQELGKRDVQVHDAIIGILTSKTLPELDDFASRDSLKIQIKHEINGDLTTGKVMNVYFSKFIIQ